MSACRHAVAFGVLAALIHNVSFAELNDAGKALLQQGRYWQGQNNAVRAAEVWKKLLLIDPQQVDALYGLGLLELRAKNTAGANRYLEQLRKAHPDAAETLNLDQAIVLQTGANPQRIENAHLAAESGDLDKAIGFYRQIFANRVPQGELALEFYSYLGYTKNGWNEAREGLERLQRQSPGNDRIKLVLAKLLIRNEGTRLDGIRRLGQLSKTPIVGGEATESWREALVWLGTPRPAELPLFEDFLKNNPQDQEIRDQLEKGRQRAAAGGVVWQQNPQVAAGLKALDAGNLAEAEKAFQQRLATQPNDPDALGGLGLLRQRQNRYDEAEQLLTRAISNGGSQWKTSLDNVRYWSLLQEARDLQEKGQTARALDVVAQAMRLNPKALDGRLALGDIQAQAGRYKEAEGNYRQVLAVQPGNTQAIRGLVDVLSQTGQADEALRLLDSLSPEEQAKFGDQGRLRSLRATQIAMLAEQRGDIQGAQNALREAVKEDPNNVWTRFSLARMYVRTGETQKAHELVDGFVAANPDNVDALYTSALLSAELEEWKAAQATMDRIPVASRTASMKELAEQIALTTQVNQAVALAKSGQRQEALSILDRLQSTAAGNVNRTATLASAYADAGDVERAQAMMRALVAQNSTPSSDLMLQYAGILLKTGEDAQVHSILTDLQNKSMGTATRKRYDDLLYQYRIRQADRLREGGDLATAYDMLAPALVQRPGDVSSTSALARMYTANGDDAKALALYKPLVQRNPKDPNVLLGAADAAVLAQDKAYAGKTLDQFVSLQNTDPASLTEAARIYRTMGKISEATALLRKAVAIEQSEKQRVVTAQRDAFGLAPNPFLGQRPQRSQVMRNVATAVPPPAETFLNNETAVAAAGNSVPPPAEAYPAVSRGNPALASNVAQRPASPAPTRMTKAQSDLLALQGAPSSSGRVAAQGGTPFAAQSGRATTPVADSISPAQRALNDLQQSRVTFVNQGLNIRSNDSEPGLSKMTDVETPFEINFPAGEGRLAVRVTPVSVDAGSMSDQAATRFGGGVGGAAGVGSQRDSGVGLGVAYARPADGFKIDLGSTPLGFEYATAVGGVSIDRPVDDNSNVRYALSLSRRAVTDSVTSFAGTTDDRDGRSWGGVTANGGRAQLSYDDSEVGTYAYGSLHRLVGHNVKSNARVEVGGGAYRYLQNEPDSRLTVGLSATVMGYSNNQDFFTYGHGGYFSPQSYVALGVPVTWSKRSDRYTYQLKGSVGLQHFQQDGADYFPNDADLQAASGGKRHDESSSSGLGYSLEAAGEYRFSPKLFVGGTFALDNARDYEQYNVGMYLRYMFDDMTGSPLALPVNPFRSPYSN